MILLTTRISFKSSFCLIFSCAIVRSTYVCRRMDMPVVDRHVRTNSVNTWTTNVFINWDNRFVDWQSNNICHRLLYVVRSSDIFVAMKFQLARVRDCKSIVSMTRFAVHSSIMTHTVCYRNEMLADCLLFDRVRTDRWRISTINIVCNTMSVVWLLFECIGYHDCLFIEKMMKRREEFGKVKENR
jgi:hypothetical protein